MRTITTSLSAGCEKPAIIPGRVGIYEPVHPALSRDTGAIAGEHVQSPLHFAITRRTEAERRFDRGLDLAGFAIALAGLLAIVLPAVCMALAGGTPA
jgi:hypothetical protein